MIADDDDPESSPPDDEVVVNAASPEGLRRQRKSLKREQDNAADFWRRLLADPVGRQELWGILFAAHTFEERFACGPNGFPQPEATWFHAGEQAFGLRLYQKLLLMGIDGIKLMHEEHDTRIVKVKRRG